MLPEQPLNWGLSRSCIRELSEYGARRKAEIGADKVYDFSLGNPSVLPPSCVDRSIIDIISGAREPVHAYTTAAGLLSLREAIAADLKKSYSLDVNPGLIYVTCGAAAALTITLKALLLPGEEVVTFAPFFPEYRVFAEGQGGVFKVVPPAEGFRVDAGALKSTITEKTKVVIINSPNNPSGVVLGAEDLTAIAKVLKECGKKYGTSIYLVTDEPYREIIYGGKPYPCAMDYYDNTIMCYSFSKSLSIPGERIGYIAVGSLVPDAANVYAAVMGAGRALGYVNPPSLFQRVMERCVGQTSDLSEYAENRRILTEGLKRIGYEYVEPEGAFYLFMKALEPDAFSFSERAKKYELLIVPSDDFGCTGYVRISYCVSKTVIENSMPAFKALYDEYKS